MAILNVLNDNALNFWYRTGLWILGLLEAKWTSQFSYHSHVVQLKEKWCLTDIAMTARFVNTTVSSQCSFLGGLDGWRYLQFVLQCGELPYGDKQDPGLPREFPFKLCSFCFCHGCWRPQFALYGHIPLYLYFVRGFLGLYRLRLPLPVVLELTEMIKQEK